MPVQHRVCVVLLFEARSVVVKVKGHCKRWALQHLLNSSTIPPSLYLIQQRWDNPSTSTPWRCLHPLISHTNTHAERLLRHSHCIWGTNLIGAAVAYSLYGDGGDPFTLTPSPGTYGTALGERGAVAGGGLRFTGAASNSSPWRLLESAIWCRCLCAQRWGDSSLQQ